MNLTLAWLSSFALSVLLGRAPQETPESPAPVPVPQVTPPAEPALPPMPPPDELLVVLKPEVERFSRLELCPAPVAGKPRLVTPAGVRLAARLAGLELTRERVVGAPQVEIVANWLELSPDDLANAAQRWLVERNEELGDKIL